MTVFKPISSNLLPLLHYILVEFPLKHKTIFMIYMVSKSLICILGYYSFCIALGIICDSLTNWKVLFIQQHQLLCFLDDTYICMHSLALGSSYSKRYSKGIIIVMVINGRLLYISPAQTSTLQINLISDI